MSRLARIGAVLAAIVLVAGCGSGAPVPAAAVEVQVTLDYGVDNPAGLVIKEQGWLEAELGAGAVRWVRSPGSGTRTTEDLRAGVLDVGFTAGVPALLARADGAPIKAVDVVSRPEWSAIVVPAASRLTAVRQLRGQRVAVTEGTDPYFFLVQALATADLTTDDLEVVNLRPVDGRIALESGTVVAWAGLDPFMARSELEAGSTLMYRNVAFHSYGLLNATEGFLARRPEVAQTVVTTYERARAWIAENPDAAVATLATAAGTDTEAARRQLVERTRFDIDPVPGAAQREILAGLLPSLLIEGMVRTEAGAVAALDTLFEPRFAEQARGTTSAGT